LQLYDQLKGLCQFDGAPPEGAGNVGDLRSSLYAAALLHDVGKSGGNNGHHKRSQELIKQHGTPLGWNEQDMRRAALVARFHCGALPVRSHKAICELLPDEQKITIRLSAILRLANALDCAHDGSVRSVRVENAAPSKRARHTNGLLRRSAVLKNEAVVICAEGYKEGTQTAQTVAAERYLLETVLRRPVIVRPMKISAS